MALLHSQHALLKGDQGGFISLQLQIKPTDLWAHPSLQIECTHNAKNSWLQGAAMHIATDMNGFSLEGLRAHLGNFQQWPASTTGIKGDPTQHQVHRTTKDLTTVMN